MSNERNETRVGGSVAPQEARTGLLQEVGEEEREEETGGAQTLEGEGSFECEICQDTGEVTVDEYVYPGEPHTAPIGSRPCICRLPGEYDESDQFREQ